MRRGFTLVEMLTVVAIVALIIGTIGILFSDVWVMTGRARVEAERSQLTVVLLKRWQQEIHATDPATWVAGDETFSAGSLEVRREGRTLVFRTPAGSWTVLVPDGVMCRFSVERHAPRADCAVFHLEFTTYRYRTAYPRSIRLVACAGGTQ